MNNNDNKSKVSFIVSFYNQPKLCDKIFNSIILQDIDEIEIIVVEDGSEFLGEQLKEFFAGYPSVSYKYIPLKANKGTFLARIEGVKHASFNYVCFLDSDDYYLTNQNISFSSLLNEVLENDLDILQFGFIKEYNGIFRKKIKLYEHIFSNKKELLDALLYKNKGYKLTFMWNKIYKTELLNKVIGLYSLNSITQKISFAEDYFMQFYIFSLASKVKLVKTPLYVYSKRVSLFNVKTKQNYYLKALQDSIYILKSIQNTQTILDRNNIGYQINPNIDGSFIKYFKKILFNNKFHNFKKLQVELDSYLKSKNLK